MLFTFGFALQQTLYSFVFGMKDVWCTEVKLNPGGIRFDPVKCM